MEKNTTSFGSLVTGFFQNYLPLQRCFSQNTVVSYRDSMKLFLTFLKEIKELQLKSISMNDFNRKNVIDFLEWLRGRGACTSTVNQRLASLKSFAEYAGIESIDYLGSTQDVQHIKAAKAVSRDIEYLTVEQMTKLINLPDVNNPTGLRHRVILTLLYDSGCRVQELCDIQIKDVHITDVSSSVTLHGKGNKYRTVTISSKTGTLLKVYMERQRFKCKDDEYLLLNKYHSKIDRDGVAYIIKRYAQELQCNDPSFPIHLHPHSFRHSKAMHMLAAGINIVYIRDFLGHVDISTTMIYVRADNRMKEEAINKLAPELVQESEYPDWTKDGDLMSFLNSL